MAGKSNTVRRDREKRPVLEAVGDASKFDRLVHERLRLGILSALTVNESLTFNELKKLLDTSDGNLSVHARKLEEAGVCGLHQELRGPCAAHRLPADGRRAACARSLPGPHGSAHPGHARKVGSLFLCLLTLNHKVLCMSESSWMATDGGRRAAACRASWDIAPAWRRRGEWWKRRPDAGVGILTLFAFSSDNWRRPPAEVDALMRLMARVPGERNVAMRGAGSAPGGDWPPRPAGREAVLRHRAGRSRHRGGRSPMASDGRGLLGARRHPGRRPRSAGTLPRCPGARHGAAGRPVDPHRRRAAAERFSTLGIGLRRTRLHAHHVAGFRRTRTWRPPCASSAVANAASAQSRRCPCTVRKPGWISRLCQSRSMNWSPRDSHPGQCSQQRIFDVRPDERRHGSNLTRGASDQVASSSSRRPRV